MRHLFVALGASLALNAAAFSQCSNLTISGSFNPGATIGFAVSGSTPSALTFALSGDPGVTTVSFGFLGSLTVGLSQPFDVVPIGMTNGSGDLTLSFQIPPNLPLSSIQNQALTLQAVSFEIVSTFPPFSFCVSNA